MQIARGLSGWWTVGLLGWLSVTPLQAQVVQLPTYRTFGIGSSVLVPDQGAAMLGGVERARSGQQTTGWPRPASRRQFSQRGSSGVEVRATVLDLSEMDAAVLAQAAAERGAPSVVSARAQRIAQGISRSDPVGRTSTSALAAAARRQTQQQRAADEAAARALIARGDACRDKGQWSTARVFYRTAGRESQDAVRELARARLAELNARTAAARRTGAHP